MGMLEADGGRAPLLARTCGQREALAAKPGAFCVADRWHRSDPDATAEVVSTSGRRGIRRVTEDRINTGYLPSIPQRCLLSIRHLESLRTVHSATDSALAEIVAQLRAQLAERDQQIADRDQQLMRKSQVLALAEVKIEVLEERLRLDRIADMASAARR